MVHTKTAPSAAVPNHLFQLFTMTAMAPPISFDADAVRDKEVLMAVHQLSKDAAVRAQYTTGTARGQPVRSYRDEPNVDPGSKTETYVALRLLVDNSALGRRAVRFALRQGDDAARH